MASGCWTPYSSTNTCGPRHRLINKLQFTCSSLRGKPPEKPSAIGWLSFSSRVFSAEKILLKVGACLPHLGSHTSKGGHRPLLFLSAPHTGCPSPRSFTRFQAVVRDRMGFLRPECSPSGLLWFWYNCFQYSRETGKR